MDSKPTIKTEDPCPAPNVTHHAVAGAFVLRSGLVCFEGAPAANVLIHESAEDGTLRFPQTDCMWQARPGGGPCFETYNAAAERLFRTNVKHHKYWIQRVRVPSLQPGQPARATSLTGSSPFMLENRTAPGGVWKSTAWFFALHVCDDGEEGACREIQDVPLGNGWRIKRLPVEYVLASGKLAANEREVLETAVKLRVLWDVEPL
jgi:hypothetical protein